MNSAGCTLFFGAPFEYIIRLLPVFMKNIVCADELFQQSCLHLKFNDLNAFFIASETPQ